MSWISGSVKLEISATLPSMMRMSSSTWWIWNRKDWKHKHDKPGASQLVTSSLEKSDHFIAAVCIYHCMSMCTVVATIQNTSKHIIFPITSCLNWPFSDRWACRRSCTRKNQSGPPGHVVDWGDPGFHQPQILCDFAKVPRGFCKAKKVRMILKWQVWTKKNAGLFAPPLCLPVGSSCAATDRCLFGCWTCKSKPMGSCNAPWRRCCRRGSRLLGGPRLELECKHVRADGTTFRRWFGKWSYYMTQQVGIIWNYTIYIHLLSTGIIIDVFFFLEHVALATHIYASVFSHMTKSPAIRNFASCQQSCCKD